jgi:hypothetical protein
MRTMVWRVEYFDGGKWKCGNNVARIYASREDAAQEAAQSKADGYRCRVALVTRAFAIRQASECAAATVGA